MAYRKGSRGQAAAAKAASVPLPTSRDDRLIFESMLTGQLYRSVVIDFWKGAGFLGSVSLRRLYAQYNLLHFI